MRLYLIFSFLLPLICLGQVSITVNKQGLYEIRNGLAGIVIPKTEDGSSVKWLAPVQSFIYADGTYSDNTANYLVSLTPPVSMKATLLRSSPDQVEVELMYRFQKKEFVFYGKKFLGGEAGAGYYRFTVSLGRNEKTVLMEEETNYDISYSVKISNGLSPNQARYRGWASETVEGGYEKPGLAYRSEDSRGYPMDATVDLFYSKYVNYPQLILWEPAGGEYNSGRYWQLFNSAENVNANLFGFFQGKPSRLLGAIHIGPRLRTFPLDAANSERNDAEIFVSIDRLAPDQSWVAKKRFQWVAFISKKKDLLPPEMNQPIVRELNRISGLGSVIHDFATRPGKLIPAFYNASIYMDADKIQALIKSIKSSAQTYQQFLMLDGSYKIIWDAWHFPDSAKSLIRQLVKMPDDMQDQYTNKEGTYYAPYRYWKGAHNFKTWALAASCLFADKSISITPNEKAKLEQLVVLMARILWDNNNMPFFDSSKVNSGPNNMAFQYQNNGRMFFALLLADDPEFQQRAKNAFATATANINSAIYSNGASFGTPHYTQATLDPILFSMLQLKQAGMGNLFKHRKIKAFAGFYSSLLTPPSVRFMNNRKLISFGDGSEESVATFGLLATGMQSTDPTFSEAMRSIYYFGPPCFSYAGPVSLAVDFSGVPKRQFNATTCSYFGYASHFRSGLNAPNETAVWVLNGDSLYDHRNDDAGEFAVYALNAPLSLSRSSFYYPMASDSRIRSVVVPEKLFPEWNGPNQPIAGRSLTNRTWPNSVLLDFANLGISKTTTVKMKSGDKEWYRKLAMVNLDENLPILLFYDSISSGEPAIWSMAMMSEGAVATPAGNITTVPKMNNNADIRELPVASPEQKLRPGLNKFTFNGQSWPLHPAGGIDWHLYTCSADELRFTISQWGTTWQNSAEQNEYLSSTRHSYSEAQQYLRLRSNRPFFNLLLPYNKKTNPYNNVVSQLSDNTIQIKLVNRRVVLNPNYYFSESGEEISLALWAEGRMEMGGYSISGGCTELSLKNKTITIRVHGKKGRRKITLPFMLNMKEKYSDVNLSPGIAGTNLNINYLGASLDLPNGGKGYKEYVFTVK